MALYVDIRKKLGDFELRASFETDGGVTGILGASGCGKSLTLRCIAGIVRPDEGRIELDGTVFFDSEKKIDLRPQRRQVGLLFQNYALFPDMTVRQNLLTGLKIREKDRERRETLLREALKRFSLEGLEERRPCQLSGGQQQRAALARILAAEPQALLLDEPFSALDSYLKYQLELELMDTLDQFPGTVLWVSHDRGEVFRTCRRVCVIDQGRSCAVQNLSQLFHAPGTEAAARLSGCKNYADAVPRGEAVLLPEWNLTLSCGRPVPSAVKRIGVRAHFVRPAENAGENVFPCAVVRVVEDVFTTIILLRPEGAAPEAPLLRMELDKMAWRALPGKDRLRILIEPRDILLFEQ